MASSSVERGAARAPPPPGQLATFYKLVDKQATAGLLCRSARLAELSVQALVQAEALFGDDSLVLADLRIGETRALTNLACKAGGAEKQALARRAASRRRASTTPRGMGAPRQCSRMYFLSTLRDGRATPTFRGRRFRTPPAVTAAGVACAAVDKSAGASSGLGTNVSPPPGVFTGSASSSYTSLQTSLPSSEAVSCGRSTRQKGPLRRALLLCRSMLAPRAAW